MRSGCTSFASGPLKAHRHSRVIGIWVKHWLGSHEDTSLSHSQLYSDCHCDEHMTNTWLRNKRLRRLVIVGRTVLYFKFDILIYLEVLAIRVKISGHANIYGKRRSSGSTMGQGWKMPELSCKLYVYDSEDVQHAFNIVQAVLPTILGSVLLQTSIAS